MYATAATKHREKPWHFTMHSLWDLKYSSHRHTIISSFTVDTFISISIVSLSFSILSSHQSIIYHAVVLEYLIYWATREMSFIVPLALLHWYVLYLKSEPFLFPRSGIPGSGHMLCPWATPIWDTNGKRREERMKEGQMVLQKKVSTKLVQFENFAGK